MSAALTQFKANIARANFLIGVADYLTKTSTLDVSDLYRAVVVLSVSALDSYVHEVVIEKIITCIKDPAQQTEALLKFQVPIRWVEIARSDPRDLGWLVGAVREGHSFLSFQQPDKIADALRLICGKVLWVEVAALLGEDPALTKQKLKLFIDRRNKIAHEADTNPLDGTLWPIDGKVIQIAVDDLVRIVDAIDVVVG